MMMKRYCNLNQSLQELLLGTCRFPPYIFPDLMRVEKLLLVEQPDAAPITILMHRKILTGCANLKLKRISLNARETFDSGQLFSS